jgi:hypothetical protein
MVVHVSERLKVGFGFLTVHKYQILTVLIAINVNHSVTQGVYRSILVQENS